jgi:hypothetical protein
MAIRFEQDPKETQFRLMQERVKQMQDLLRRIQPMIKDLSLLENFQTTTYEERNKVEEDIVAMLRPLLP